MSTNSLRNVQTYQMAALAFLQNQNCFVSDLTNKKFKDFENLTAQLGDTVTFELPPRMVADDTLVATFQGVTQRFETLTVGKAKNSSYEMTNPEFVFNTEDYMNRIASSAMQELGAVIEADVARSTLAPYRFFGDGIAQINSFSQLAQAISNFEDYGATRTDMRGVLPLTKIPGIVNSGLNQFVPDRNDEIAVSWKLGEFANTDWYTSNRLPVHISGNAAQGQNADTLLLTAVSVDGTTLTFSGVTGTVGAVKQDDLLEFSSATLRYLTFIGHTESAQAVQVRVLADADAAAGSVTVTVTPALISTPNLATTNLNRALVPGSDAATIAASHRRAMITSGDSLYLAMPMLPNMSPYTTANATDPNTGVSVRTYYGGVFGQGKAGWVNDVIWGYKQVPEYSMALLFPLT